MEGTSVTILISIVAALSSICSILAFLLGRKSAAKAEGEYKGRLDTNIANMTSLIDSVHETLEKIDIKIELSAEKIDTKYERLLIATTSLDSSYKSIHLRVNKLEADLDTIRRNGNGI